ncbi:MAG: SNF2-related protein, partial [Burkholderiales bacterium]
MCRTVAPGRGWLRILWDQGLQHEDTVADHIERVLTIPGCRLLQSNGGIDLPHTAWMLPAVTDLLRAVGVETPRFEPSAPPEWTPIQPLYAFQQTAVEMVVADDKPGFLLGDDMGLGKTREAIVAAQRLRLHCDNRPALVIAPLFLREVWLRELLAMGAIADRSEFVALGSRTPTRGLPPAQWYFVHYDVVEAWSGQFLANRALAPCVTVLDEAHWVKNYRTKRAKGAQVAALGTRYRILLTGTPMENRPAELWHLLTIACGAGSWGFYSEFRERYAGAMSDGYGLNDTGPTHIEELRARMVPSYLRRRAQDVALQLPPLTRNLHTVDRSGLAAEHDNLIGSADAQLLIQALLEGLVGAEVLAMISKLRQMTSKAKLDATIAYAQSAIEQGESCVVFTWERATAHAIARKFLGGYVVTGEQYQT